MKTIAQLRRDIEKIDEQIIKKLALREKKVRQIGLLKKTNNTEIKDSSREAKLAKLHEKICEQCDVSYSLVKKIFNLIIVNSRKIQI